MRLFLENINSQQLPGKKILETARGTVRELESINDGLLKISYLKRDPETEPLAKILDNITKNIKNIVSLEIRPEVINLAVRLPHNSIC